MGQAGSTAGLRGAFSVDCPNPNPPKTGGGGGAPHPGMGGGGGGAPGRPGGGGGGGAPGRPGGGGAPGGGGGGGGACANPGKGGAGGGAELPGRGGGAGPTPKLMLMESRSSFLGGLELGSGLAPSPAGVLMKVSRSVWTHTLRKLLGGCSSSVETQTSCISPRSWTVLYTCVRCIPLMSDSRRDTTSACSPRTWKICSSKSAWSHTHNNKQLLLVYNGQ